MNDVISESDTEFILLPSGQIPINPAELLGSNRMRELIQTLTEEYDYIIVDGPPALGFADFHTISGLVDGVAVVVRSGKTPTNSIRELIDTLWSLKANFLGVIVNGNSSIRKAAGIPNRGGVCVESEVQWSILNILSMHSQNLLNIHAACYICTCGSEILRL
jgi:Mrp family chromosome partitioning ATPase